LIYAPYVIYAHGIFYNEFQQWKLLASRCPDHIREAIEEVYYGIKEPEQALNDPAVKSAKVLGW
jgi:hypothetical protein